MRVEAPVNSKAAECYSLGLFKALINESFTGKIACWEGGGWEKGLWVFPPPG